MAKHAASPTGVRRKRPAHRSASTSHSAPPGPLPTDVAISVVDVTKRYRKVVALDGMNLEVPFGSIVGLVGPNGAGKTTLIRALVGALTVDEGTVRVLGRDPAADRRSVRTTLGYMPQAPVLYQDLTVRENIAFFARGHLNNGVAERVREVVAFVDLADAIDRPVHTLSGGQSQRASLATALVHRPELLLLDEPTAGVDPELRHAFWNRFRELADSGVTMVVSTHQMDEVAHCDRVVLMRRGRALSNARPDQLLASGGVTVRVRRQGSVAEHRLSSLPDDLPRLLHELGLDPAVDRIDVDGPTLEEVVLHLISGPVAP